MKKFLPFLTALCLLFGSVWTMQGQAPQIVSLNPDSNATEVPLDVELQLEFDVDIIFNSSDIPKSIQVIETGTSTTVVDGFTYKGNAYDGPIDKNADTLFIDLSALSSPLSPETQYSVIIEEGAVESAADSTDFAGIDDINTRWRFTTVSRPGLSSKWPLNNATGVTGLETLTLTFDETINLGTNKNLYIYKDGGTLFQTINTTDDAGLITISGSGYDVNISHNAFNGGQIFYVYVEEGFVTSRSTGVGSAAIDGSTEWSFTSAEGPGIAAFSPANTPEPNVHANTPLTIKYNEPVSLASDKNVIIYYDSGSIFQTINTTTDAALFSYNSTDNKLTISHDNFPGSTTFNIVVEEGLVTADDNNIASEVIDETNLGWTFTTASAPYISSFAPGGETNVEGNRVLELNFSENIAPGDNKNLYIYRASDNQLFQTINTSTDAGLFAITDNSLQISHDPLWGNTSFYVLADEGLAVSASTAIAAEGISSTTRWTFTTTGGPVVETYTPGAASTGVSISAPLEIDFNENIAIGTSGSITICLAADSSVVESINYGSGQLSASNDTLIINHLEWKPETEYFINVDTGLVLSSSTGTPWEGISDASWSFTTAGAPQVSGYYPLQGEAKAPVDQSLILTFTENIKTGSSGYIKIRKEGNTYFQDIPFDAGLLSINNNELHVSHDDFNPATTYFVRIDSNVVRSLATDVPFPGISDTTQWRFTTAFPPTVSSLSPANGSEVSSAAENLIITFSEIIEAGTSGLFRIHYANSGGVRFQSVSIDETEYIDITDSILTISHLDFTPDTAYYITIDPGFVKSAVSGVDFGGIQDTTTWTFTAPSGPQIITCEPGNNSIDIPVDSVLTLTFDENIVRGTGNMIIHHAGGTDAVTISASSSSNLTIDRNRLSFPNITMPYDETLYVTIDEGFVKSESSGFNFSGITSTTEWVFTTLPSPPEFSSGYPYFYSITPGNIDLALMTNKDADYYFVVTSSSTPPSDTQIMNGQKSNGSPAAASGSGSLQANNDTIHPNIDISALSEGYHWLHAIAKHPDKDIFSETASIEIDKLPPITTIKPTDGTTNFPENGNMTISFNEPVYSAGTAIDNTNVSDFVLLMQGQDTIACSVSINTSTNVITINPDANLSPLTEYTVTMEAVEDQIGNVQSGSTTSTFTTDKINIWSGGGADPGDWTDPDNWSSGSFTENTSIFVPSSATPLIADSSVTVYNIDLEAGAVMQHSADTITVNGEFRLRSSADKNASYLNTGGILIVNADSVKIEQVITADTIN
ncbi:Ig-like domain-containing protein [Anaerophaga thermohalophila]|uniref:Ig-like domain-containing protein n=1 Tax=Anaerophaga thermohalophila TaxID=177400 RepID=UPI0009E5892A|nr:Ig-like domain-containing protein [Anaerophaga thermohalophila]